MLNEIVDLRHLSWSKIRQSSGTAGSFLKSYSFSNGKKVYYKLSFFDDVNHIFGYESINEIIAERILEELNIEHLEYELIHAVVNINGSDYETFLCSSLDFKENNERKITLENFYDLWKSKDETKMEFFKRFNFDESIYNMILIDFIINNRDRHGANIEVLYNSKTNEYRLAPLFDHGLSFLSPKYLDEDIKEFDTKKIYRANSYIGTSDLKKNLDLIPIEKIPALNLDYNYIFGDLYEYINNDYLDKAKEMLKERVDYIELNENASDYPVFFHLFIEKNKYIINNYFSEKFLNERIIPYERHNIGSILRENHMYNYNPIDFYIRAYGKSSMDDSYIRKIKPDEILDNVKERRKHLIKDFIVLKNNKMIVFFINGETRIIDIDNNPNKPFLSIFGEEIIFDSKYRFDYDYLYKNGKDFPLLYDDLLNYMNDNILNSGDIYEKYSISRQYVNQKKEEFVRVKDNLYLKNDVIVKLKK